MIEPQARRRDVARDLGAAATLDPTSGDFRDGAADLTQGRGFDAIIEAAGVPSAMALALEIAAHSGRIAYAGISVGSMVQAPLGLIQSKALRLRGLIGSVGVWPQTIRFIASGAVDPSRIVTATIPCW